MRSLVTEVPDLSTSGTAFKTTENYPWVVHPVKTLTVRGKAESDRGWKSKLCRICSEL